MGDGRLGMGEMGNETTGIIQRMETIGELQAKWRKAKNGGRVRWKDKRDRRWTTNRKSRNKHIEE